MSHDGPQEKRDSFAPVLIVLTVGLALVVGVVALAGWAGLFVMLAIGGVLGFAVMHYLLWGWWMARHLHDAESERERNEREKT